MRFVDLRKLVGCPGLLWVLNGPSADCLRTCGSTVDERSISRSDTVGRDACGTSGCYVAIVVPPFLPHCRHRDGPGCGAAAQRGAVRPAGGHWPHPTHRHLTPRRRHLGPGRLQHPLSRVGDPPRGCTYPPTPGASAGSGRLVEGVGVHHQPGTVSSAVLWLGVS